MYYNIGIIRKNIANKYLYKSDISLKVGQLLIVDFNKKNTIGIVLDLIESSNYDGEIKEIQEILQYSIPKEYVKFIELFANYNLVPLGTALQLMVPFAISNINKGPRKIKSIKPKENKIVTLNNEQNNAVNSIWHNINKSLLIILILTK